MKLLTIGCGAIGRRHAENAKKYAEVSIYDENDLVSQTVGAALQVPTFRTLASALQWLPDVVVVSTPPHSHVSIASQAIVAGAHVLIEKPISNVVHGVDLLIRTARENNRKIYVVCNMRFHPAVIVVQKNLTKIGRPFFARAHYGNYLPNMRPDRDYRSLYAAKRSLGGGVILDAIHEVDYLRWLLGEVESVIASAATLSDLEIDVEDYASLLLTHNNGVRSEIHLDYLQQCKRRGCEIVGEQGTLLWESLGKKPELCTVKLFLKATQTWETLYQETMEDLNQPYDLLMQSLIHALQGETTILATAEDGLAALKVSLAASLR